MNQNTWDPILSTESLDTLFDSNQDGMIMEEIENTNLFNSYLKEKNFKNEYSGTLWAEGPCYIPHLKKLIWSDIPNNRMMKFFDGKVSEFKNPSKKYFNPRENLKLFNIKVLFNFL